MFAIVFTYINVKIISLDNNIVFVTFHHHNLGVAPRSLENTLAVFLKDVKSKINVYKYLKLNDISDELSVIINDF